MAIRNSEITPFNAPLSSRLGFSALAENQSFGGSGRPLGALKPSKKVGGFADDRFSAKSLNPNPSNPNPNFSHNRNCGVHKAPSLRESHQWGWGAKTPTSIDGLPGRRRPFGGPTSQLFNGLGGCQGPSQCQLDLVLFWFCFVWVWFLLPLELTWIRAAILNLSFLA